MPDFLIAGCAYPTASKNSAAMTTVPKQFPAPRHRERDDATIIAASRLLAAILWASSDAIRTAVNVNRPSAARPETALAERATCAARANRPFTIARAIAIT